MMPDGELRASLAALEAQYVGLRNDISEIKDALRGIWTKLDEATRQAQQVALQVAVLAENAQHAAAANRARDEALNRIVTRVWGNGDGGGGIVGQVERLSQHVEVLARAHDSGGAKVWQIVVVAITALSSAMAAVWISK